MTKIIAFSGRKKSGKTTAAHFVYGLYLAGTGRFKDIGISNDGLLEVVKQDGSLVVFDLQKYYLGIGDIDPEIMDTINMITPTVKVYSFADPLKADICMNVLGLSYEQCYDENGKNELTHLRWADMPGLKSKKDRPEFMTGREVMEYVGTDIFRKIYLKSWSQGTINKIKRDSPQIAIIMDTRFPDEVSPVQENNGIVIRLTRNPENSDSEPESALDKDKFDWDKFDYIIDNENLNIGEQCDTLYPIILQEIEKNANN